MKKKFQILAATFITVAFISCSKEKKDMAETNYLDELASASNVDKGGGSSFNPGRRLEFWFPFNGNIDEANGKPVDAVATTEGADAYTEDRFGTANSAIKFDGSYGITLTGMRMSTNMSVSAWVKYELANTSFYFFYAPLSLGQMNDKFSGSVSTPSTTGVISNSMDAGWHHLVATYDGSYIKFYVDGNFVGEQYNGGSINGGADGTFWVSYAGPNSFWNGCIDDLRFYTRTLKPNEVQSLYNL